MAFSNLLLITFVAFTAAGPTTTAQSYSLNFTASHDSTPVTSITYITATPKFRASSPPVVTTSIESSPPVATKSIEVTPSPFQDSTSVISITDSSATPSIGASSPPVVAASIESSPPVATKSIEITPSPSSIIGGSSPTNFNPIYPKNISSLLQKYKNITEIVCTNRETCCKGNGNTDIKIKFTMKDCNTHFPGLCMNSTLTIKNIKCFDAIKICTCRAAFLNTSLALVVLGVFLHLVGT